MNDDEIYMFLEYKNRIMQSSTNYMISSYGWTLIRTDFIASKLNFITGDSTTYVQEWLDYESITHGY